MSTNLTKQQLESGKLGGTHVVKEPIQGFKRIQCDCDPVLGLFLNTDTKNIASIATLEIPPGAKIIRAHSFYEDRYVGGETDYVSNKLRANKAVVKNIEPKYDNSQKINNLFSTIKNCVCYSLYDKEFKYEIGQTVTPKKDFNSDSSRECESGIHFFLDKDEAKDYLR